MQQKKINRSKNMGKLLYKILSIEPYSKMYQKFVRSIWESTVKNNGMWLLSDLGDIYLGEIYFQILKRAESHHKSNSRKYIKHLLQEDEQVEQEIEQIMFNARSRTIELYMKSIGRKRKSKKRIDRDFNELYRYSTPTEKKEIKKKRISGINRYLPSGCVELGTKTYSLCDNSYDRLQSLEVLDLLCRELNEEDLRFVIQLMSLSCQDIAELQGIKLESIKRKRRRLEVKIRKLLYA